MQKQEYSVFRCAHAHNESTTMILQLWFYEKYVAKPIVLLDERGKKKTCFRHKKRRP